MTLEVVEAAGNTAHVTERNGSREPVDVNKIVRAVTRVCDGLTDVDPMLVALKTIAGLYDGATTRELDELSIRTAEKVSAGALPVRAKRRSDFASCCGGAVKQPAIT